MSRVTITERQLRIIAGIVDLFNSNAEQIDYDSLPFDDSEQEYVRREEVAEIHRLFWESDDCIGRISTITVDEKFFAPAPQGWESVGTDHEDMTLADANRPLHELQGTCYFVSLPAAERYYKDYNPGQNRAFIRSLVADKIEDGEIRIGKPPILPGQELKINAEGRYVIIG